MPILTVLGTASAIPSSRRENTHLALRTERRTILIDCSGNPFIRLEQAGISPLQLTDLILTHFHPDHVSGVPSLLMGLWLLGYQRELHLYGLPHTLDRLMMVMGVYGWERWPEFFPLAIHRLPQMERTLLLEDDEVRILSFPMHHIIPTIGLRMEFRRSGKVLAYSSDTEPCVQAVHLAEGADVLIHEASGEGVGHSSAIQAAQIARQAEVGALYLIHYPDGDSQSQEELLAAAREHFPGPIYLAEELLRLEF